MRRFYDDSSQAKTLSKDRSIHFAVKYFTQKPLQHFELRDYSKSPYFVINTFVTRATAVAAKEFHVLQEGPHFAVVAVDAFTSEFNRYRG